MVIKTNASNSIIVRTFSFYRIIFDEINSDYEIINELRFDIVDELHIPGVDCLISGMDIISMIEDCGTEDGQVSQMVRIDNCGEIVTLIKKKSG